MVPRRLPLNFSLFHILNKPSSCSSWRRSGGAGGSCSSASPAQPPARGVEPGGHRLHYALPIPPQPLGGPGAGVPAHGNQQPAAHRGPGHQTGLFFTVEGEVADAGAGGGAAAGPVAAAHGPAGAHQGQPLEVVRLLRFPIDPTLFSPFLQLFQFDCLLRLCVSHHSLEYA